MSDDFLRSAASTIRGYLSQALWTVDRWFALGDEVLLCEGNEDIDRLLFDKDGRLVQLVAEQIKDLESNLSARSIEVYESIFNFLLGFHRYHSQGQRCTFVFTTTADRAEQQISTAQAEQASGLSQKAKLTIDVLKTWGALQGNQEKAERARAIEALTTAIKELVRHYLPKTAAKLKSEEAQESYINSVNTAVTYLDVDQRWSVFIDAVSWQFSQEKLEDLRERLHQKAVADERTRHLPPVLIIDRLLVAAIHAASGAIPGLRELRRQGLTDIAQTTREGLVEWSDQHQSRVLLSWFEQIESRLTVVEEKISPEGQRRLAIERLKSALSDNALQAAQLDRIGKRYFHSRVIPGLFIEPPDFAPRYEMLRLSPGIMKKVSKEWREISEELLARLAWPPSVAGLFPSPPDVRETLLSCAEQIALGPGKEMRKGVELARKVLQDLMQHEDVVHLEKLQASGKAPPNAADTLNKWRGEFRYSLRRAFGSFNDAPYLALPIWCLATPAGRGKSNFIWEMAQRLSKDAIPFCLLTGRELDGASRIEQIVSTELRLPWIDIEAFHEVGRRIWRAQQKPFVVLIDAVNEARCDIGQAADQLARFLEACLDEPWLRVLVSCRDPYWEVFLKRLSGLQELLLEERLEGVAPELDYPSIDRYLTHFQVQNVVPEDFAGELWFTNPLFLRIFCETYEEHKYDGAKPIQLRSFLLLRSYFERKQAELVERGMVAFELENLLDDLAALMIESGRQIGAAENVPRFVVPEARAQKLLSQPIRVGESLYQVLLDMDLVLRIDIGASLRKYVAFTFERMQDYFVARALLNQADDSGTPITDAYLDSLKTSSAVTPTALATLLALAIDIGRVTQLDALPRHAAASVTDILDLVETGRLAKYEAFFVTVAQVPEVLERLAMYLRDQLLAQKLMLRSFVEVFGLGILARAALALPLRERHRRFYRNSELIDAMADVLSIEIRELRGWVRRSFAGFPATVEATDGRVLAAILLLGTNSPQVRDLAHEWLFWFGRFDPERVCGALDEFLAADDLFIRERVVALEYGLLHRHTILATPQRLLAIYRATLDRKSPSFSPHYLIVEFARKVMLEHQVVLSDQLSAEEWARIEHPPRLLTPKVLPRAESEWTVRGPIHADQSRYTLGHRFWEFAVPSLDVAVQETLGELAGLGYDSTAYDWLDKEIVERSPDLRVWGPTERRYERFGKGFANLASWNILGRWAETQPIGDTLKEPTRPFALAQPEYDYLFTVEPSEMESAQSLAQLDFPEQMPIQDWAMHDEIQYLEAFLRQFPDEVLLYGVVDRIKADRRFDSITRCALILPEMEAAFAWAATRLQARRGSFYGSVPEDEISEAFEFHNLRDAGTSINALEVQEPVVAAYASYVRTMNEGDRSVTTLSPRMIRAGDFRQLETAGEFADDTGARVVRRLQWGEYEAEHRADIVLIKRTALEQCCAKLKLSYCQFHFVRLSGLDAKRRYDQQLQIERWAARFPRAMPVAVPQGLEARLNEREQRLEAGEQPFGFEEFVGFYLAAVRGDEESIQKILGRPRRPEAVKAQWVPPSFLVVEGEEDDEDWTEGEGWEEEE